MTDECLKDTRFCKVIDKDVLDIFKDCGIEIANEDLLEVEPETMEVEPSVEEPQCDVHKCRKHGDKYNIEITINDQEIDPKAKDVEIGLKSKDVDIEKCPVCEKVPCECKDNECLKDSKYMQTIDKEVLDILSEIDNTIINENKKDA